MHMMACSLSTKALLLAALALRGGAAARVAVSNDNSLVVAASGELEQEVEFEVLEFEELESGALELEQEELEQGELELEFEEDESRLRLDAEADAQADAEADARDGVAWHDMHIEEHLDEDFSNWICYNQFTNHLVAAQHTELVELGTLMECHMLCESMPDCAAVNFHKAEHQCHIKLGNFSQQDYTWALEESDHWDTCYHQQKEDEDEWWDQPTTTPLPLEKYLGHAQCNDSVEGSRLRFDHWKDAILESGEICKCRWHGLTGRLNYLQGDSIACDHHGLFHKFDPRVYAGCFCEDVWKTCDRLVKGSLPRKVPEEGTNHFCKCRRGSLVTGPHKNCPAPIYDMRKFNPYVVAGCSCEQQETSKSKYYDKEFKKR